jgi:hypothetical protein
LGNNQGRDPIRLEACKQPMEVETDINWSDRDEQQEVSGEQWRECKQKLEYRWPIVDSDPEWSEEAQQPQQQEQVRWRNWLLEKEENRWLFWLLLLLLKLLCVRVDDLRLPSSEVLLANEDWFDDKLAFKFGVKIKLWVWALFMMDIGGDATVDKPFDLAFNASLCFNWFEIESIGRLLFFSATPEVEWEAGSIDLFEMFELETEASDSSELFKEQDNWSGRLRNGKLLAEKSVDSSLCTIVVDRRVLEQSADTMFSNSVFLFSSSSLSYEKGGNRECGSVEFVDVAQLDDRDEEQDDEL